MRLTTGARVKRLDTNVKLRQVVFLIKHNLAYYLSDLADPLGAPLAEKKRATEHHVLAVVLPSGTQPEAIESTKCMLGVARKADTSTMNVSAKKQ